MADKFRKTVINLLTKSTAEKKNKTKNSLIVAKPQNVAPA